MNILRRWFGGTPAAQPGDVSRERVEELRRAGKLVELWLMPKILGGVADVRNILWVPPAVAAEKAEVDELVRSWVAAGEPANYSAAPEYAGRSMVPSRIVVRASTATRQLERTLIVPAI
jgi:hypothetical protein